MDIMMNRRKFERLRTQDLNVLFGRNWTEIATGVDVINVSLGGLCFLTKSAMEIDEKILLTFPFETKFIVLRSSVTWVEGREVGVKFIESHDRILSFMQIFNREYPKFDENGRLMKNKLVAPPGFFRKVKDDQKFDKTEVAGLVDYN